MTSEQIQARAEREMLVFETAKRIREALDEARKAYGPDAWDEEEREAQVIELVTEEVES